MLPEFLPGFARFLCVADSDQIRSVILAATAELEKRNALGLANKAGFGMRVLNFEAQAAGIAVDEILGPGRTNPVFLARARVARSLRQEGWSLPRIGRLLNRDHTSIHSALRRLEEVERVIERKH
jgi:chromosomal replication initiation ATPase DnaA